MTSCLLSPQCGQVRVDVRIASAMALLPDRGREARIGGCLSQQRDIGLVRIQMHRCGLVHEIDLHIVHTWNLLQRFLDGDRASRTSHILDIEGDGFRRTGENRSSQ